MKFLCIDCDEAMTMRRADAPDRSGSIAAVFECPACGRGMAMLTNAMETQVVQSLGVELGPKGERASKCPFSGAVQTGAGRGAAEGAGADDQGVGWTQGALDRLDNIPEFVRPMAKQGIEQFARSSGKRLVTETLLDEARGRFGM